jgi:catalase (peroxidase I)
VVLECPKWQNPLRVKYLKIINKIDSFNEYIPSAKNLTKQDLFSVIGDMDALLSELQDLYEKEA